jgi:cell division protein FtsW
MATRNPALRVAETTVPKKARARSKPAERGHPAVLLAITVATLVLLGLVMILSASSVSAFADYGSPFMFFKKQLIWAALGVAGYIFLARFDYKKLKKRGNLALGIAIVMLLAVLVPGIGITVGGSARWIGAGPLSFQPSEFAKLALILFAADAFARQRESSLRHFANTAVPMIPGFGALALLVMLQPDMGTTMILGFIAFGVMFVAGAPLKYITPLGLAGTALAVFGALAEPYRRARVTAFLDPWKDPLNTGYQTIQSLIALGSGGWFGVGLGASRQKWSYIPNSHTDFIFAILGEEMGLVGTLTVLGLFAFLIYLGVRVAKAAPDRYGMLLASGITLWIGAQALINMGAVTAAAPITGVPLPLVSFGGSSLVISLMAMGILTNIASQGRATRTRRAPGERASSTR